MRFVFPKYPGFNIEEQDCSFAYYSKNPLIRWAYIQRLKEAAALIPENRLGREEKILDLGTGCGFMLPTLSKKGKVVAVDYSEKFLRKAKIMAKANNLSVSYVKADARHLPFGNRHFSLINTLSVLEHIEDIENAVKEIRRIIKDNGLLIVGIPIERFLVNSLFALLALKDNLLEGRLKSSKSYRKNKYQDVHYSDIMDIEAALSKYFIIKKSQKIFSNYIPDAFSLYKVYKCVPKYTA